MDGSRMLWVDQICINQDDLDERSSQVLLMRQIYQQARKTVAWLGEPEEEQDVSLIKELAELLSANTLSHEERVRGLPAMMKIYPEFEYDIPFRLNRVQLIQDVELLKSWIDVREADTMSIRRRQAITRVFNCDWFQRVWVVQEVLVAAETEILYGPMSISIEILHRVGTTLMELEQTILGWYQALHNTSKGFSHFSDLVSGRSYLGNTGCPDRDFLHFMHEMQKRKSTDPRDKVYALLGLKESGTAPDVTPDYRKSVAELYADTAISFIKESDSLELIGFVEGYNKFRCCSSPIPDLPSWAPNWSQKFHGLRPLNDITTGSTGSFRSARDLPSSAHSSGRILHVKGKVVGSIRTAFQMDFDELKPFWNGLRIWFPINDVIKTLKLEAGEYEDLTSTLLRTLLADGSWSSAQPLRYSISKILEVLDSQAEIKRLNQIDSEDYKALTYLQRCSLVLQKRRMFDAVGLGKVFLGLGNRFMRRGDMVCVLYGSKVPVVIRRQTSLTDPTGVKYKVVCQCYLDGWMYGDYPLDSWWGEFEQRPETFALV